jgi:hypothetical protein
MKLILFAAITLALVVHNSEASWGWVTLVLGLTIFSVPRGKKTKDFTLALPWVTQPSCKQGLILMLTIFAKAVDLILFIKTIQMLQACVSRN